MLFGLRRNYLMTNEIKIGKSDVTVPNTLGLGTNKVGGHNLFDDLKDENGYAVVKEALNSGISLLDTAFAYGNGRSEEIIGDVIQDYDRSNIVLATKAAHDPSKNGEFNNSPKFLKQSVDDALKRLKTDYIDIFYIHFPDKDTPKAEAVGALNELKEAGKIRAIGVSNFSPDQIKEANADGLVDIAEDNYSLVHRGVEQTEFPYLQENNISFVPYFPLAAGLLTGKYGSKDGSKFDQYSAQQYQTIISALDKVREIANGHDATITQTIIAWYLQDPAISVVIPGARTADQVKSNVAALDVNLSQSEFDQIDQLFQGF
ncbi:Aryl-alcohol dehydrogenase related enzyme [Ligilactobacillus pobuzihii E100301 = KCTC 13174]|uniref:Aryl-alcohol dehydrogenase related enzyme n=2 Tax=Ligilactobacillus pobuzihii TaxID=449659 RepID=A0A0R2LD88_9LACO|nr:Aryl-alcohol dehydrogenase related enzyme [Ligilactobacillus pobuzihii E100301 = KCTC 13174]KRN99457.1 Aryl-alcohol dehydrogenase related enzyme [Ligilactobacillus pobuzihii]